jgi:hypothetical protein
MIPTNDRLAFLVRFLRMDLSRLRPPAWDRLQKDIRAFLATEQIQERANTRWQFVVGPALASQRTPLTEEEVRGLQQNTREFVTIALKEEHLFAPGDTPVRATKPVTLTASYQLWCPGSARFLFIEGALPDMFLLVLHLLLIRGADTHLRACPECETIFLRVRKQIFCTTRCKKRANIRAWRQTPKGKEATVRAKIRTCQQPQPKEG